MEHGATSAMDGLPPLNDDTAANGVLKRFGGSDDDYVNTLLVGQALNAVLLEDQARRLRDAP